MLQIVKPISLVSLALCAACASRQLPSVTERSALASNAAEAPRASVHQSLDSDPPLPGEPREGLWTQLEDPHASVFALPEEAGGTWGADASAHGMSSQDASENTAPMPQGHHHHAH
ncbi:MAG: hypothetical protein Q8Q09_07665 [Deltaproteobacteria bacterium]|nr:hypothetical protein [Deltaproteobacteria bacterium]